MLDIGALLLGTGFFGSSLVGTLLGEILGGFAYEGICKGFCSGRDRLLNPSPQNHDLQKTFLRVLKAGIQTVTRKHISKLSPTERKQVETWQKQVFQVLDDFICEIENGGFAWKITDDMGMLLKASYEELYHCDQAQIASELQQFKATYEQSFLRLDELPARFREAFRTEWLASVYLHLAEVIKSGDPDVVAMFQTSVSLDIQGRVQNVECLVQALIDSFSNPQQFLGVVQPGVQIDIEGLRSEVKALHQELLEQFNAVEAKAAERHQELMQRLADREAQPKPVSIVIDNNYPKVVHWQGRVEEIIDIGQWLEKVNLVGITGLGGYGKSALAVKIYEAADFNQNQKFWVNVNQPYSFSELGRWLLGQLGYQLDEKTGDDLLATELVNRLAAGRYLLVLDNLEMLLQSNGQWQYPAYEEFFLKWIEYGRNSVILITSREQPCLPPNNSHWHPLTGLLPEAGENLLRAQGIQGAQAEIREFVELADGHPLLLNLAASLLEDRAGKNPDISALKDPDLNLFEIVGLHRGDPEASVRKLFDASLIRMDDRLKTLLFNVSVYRLPFNAAAAAVMLPEAGEGEQDADTLRQVEQDLRQLLVRRSLLQEQRDATGERRFRFQPLILNYVKQKAGDLIEAHERAIAYYLTIAKEEPWTTDDDLTAYFETFHHYCELKQYDRAYKILDVCYKFLDLRGYNLRLVSLYERLVQEWQPSSQQDKSDLGWAWTRVGVAYRSLGQYQPGIKSHQQQLDIAREIGDHQGKASSLGNLGIAYHFLGQYQPAVEHYQQSLDIAREIGDRQREAGSLGGLGNAYQSLGQYQPAIEFHQQCLEIMRQIGNRQGEASSLGNLGLAYEYLGQYQQGLDYHQQSLEIKRQIGDYWGEASSLSNLGNAYWSLGQYPQALDYHQQSLDIAREIGDRQGEASSLGNLGNTYGSLGQYQRAIEYYQQQLDIAREIGDRRGEAISLSNLGNAYWSLGQYPQAIDYHQQSLDIAHEIGDRQGEASSLGNLGNTYGSLGQYQRAIECLQQSLAMACNIGDRYIEADSLKNLGNAYHPLKQYEQAVESLQQSLEVARQIGERFVEAEALNGLGIVYHALGQYQEAIKFHQQSLDIAQEIGARWVEANAWFNLGITWRKLGRKSQAITAYRNARELYQSMGLDAKVQDCDNAIQQLVEADLATASNLSTEIHPQPASKRNWLRAAVDWFLG